MMLLNWRVIWIEYQKNGHPSVRKNPAQVEMENLLYILTYFDWLGFKNFNWCRVSSI